RAVDHRDDRGDVRELVFHAIGVAVTAGAAAAAIHGVDGKMPLQGRDDGRPAAVVRGSSVNQQNHRAMASAKITNRDAVCRPNAAHARSRAWPYRARDMIASPKRPEIINAGCGSS